MPHPYRLAQPVNDILASTGLRPFHHETLRHWETSNKGAHCVRRPGLHGPESSEEAAVAKGRTCDLRVGAGPHGEGEMGMPMPGTRRLTRY